MRRRRPSHTTVPAQGPPHQPRRPSPPRRPRVAPAAPRRAIARLVDDGDASLLDVLDNLLNKGVVLDANIVLALANVDLVYLRLSALLCAADRILPGGR